MKYSLHLTERVAAFYSEYLQVLITHDIGLALTARNAWQACSLAPASTPDRTLGPVSRCCALANAT